MTVGEARSELMTSIGQVGGEMSQSLVSPDIVFQWFNRGARRIVMRALCLTGVSYFSTEADQSLYSLPDDCIRLISVTYDGFPLVEITENLANQINDTAGVPEAYINHHPNGIRLYPTPNNTKVVYEHYYRRAVSISADSDTIDLPDELADLLVDYAMWRYYLSFQPDMERDAFIKFKAELDEYVAAQRRAARTGMELRNAPRDDFFGSLDIAPVRIVVDN